MPRPVGYLANRAAGRWVFDVLVALLAWATVLAWAADAPYNSYHDVSHHPPGAVKTVVLALMAAPLVVRRMVLLRFQGLLSLPRTAVAAR